MWVLLLAVSCMGHDLATIRKVFADSYTADTLAKAMPAEAQAGRDVVFSRLDSDGDGLVTRAEIEAAFPMSKAGDSSALKQGHLSLGGRSSMWVMWVTDDKQSTPFVRWGAAASRLTLNATGTSHTYNVGLFGWHKWLHQVAISGLAANLVVYYQFGNGALESDVNSFQMPGADTASIAMLADQGTIEPLGNAVAQQIARDANKQRIDAVHTAGDLAYAWKSVTPGPEEQWIWDLYQQEQTAYALHIPQMVTIGNHEQFANATAFLNRYRMPSELVGDAPFYYAYNVGPVHIIAFSTDGPPCYAQPSCPQLAWLAADLAAVNRTATPWVVFTTHRPLYCSAVMEFGEHAQEAAVVEPLLLAGGVDLVVTGHVHVYERILPTIRGKPVVSNATNVFTAPGAPAYVVQGTGGCLLDTDRTEWVSPTPLWSAVRERWHYGYALLTANATHLHYAFRLEKDNSVYDDFWILK